MTITTRSAKGSTLTVAELDGNFTDLDGRAVAAAAAIVALEEAVEDIPAGATGPTGPQGPAGPTGPAGSGGSTPLNNTLTSTSTAEALTANQGRALKVLIDALPTIAGAIGGTAGAPTVLGLANQAALDARINSLATVLVDNLVAGAPAALNTLVELAAAVDNNASFAAAITTALALKAPLASPALTGTPTAPTAGAGTNTTQVATTAFVAAADALLQKILLPGEAVAGTTYTLVAADAGKIKVLTNATGTALTVPPGLASGFGVTVVRAPGAGPITLVEGAGVAVENTADNLVLSATNAMFTLVQNTGVNSYTATGPFGSQGTTVEVVNNLTDSSTTKALSAAQGGVLKAATDAVALRVTALESAGASGTPLVWISNEFFGTGADDLDPFAVITLAAGSIATVSNTALNVGHPGIAEFRASTPVDTGVLLWSNSALRMEAGFIFKATWAPRDLAVLSGRLGFADSLSVAAASNGAYWDIVNGVMTPRVKAQDTSTNEAGTAYNGAALVNDTWLYSDIEVLTTTTTRFRLINAAGTVVFNETITAPIPTQANREVYAEVGFWSTATGTARGIAVIDKVGFGDNSASLNPTRF